MGISRIIKDMRNSIEDNPRHSIEHYTKAVDAAQHLCDGAYDFFEMKNHIAKAYFNAKNYTPIFGAFVDSDHVPCISFSKTDFFIDGFYPENFVVGMGSLTFIDKVIYTRFNPCYSQTDKSLHVGFIWNNGDDVYVAEYREDDSKDLPRSGWIGKLKAVKDVDKSEIMIKVIPPICTDNNIQHTCLQSFINLLPDTPVKPSCDKTVWNGHQWISSETFDWSHQK